MMIIGHLRYFLQDKLSKYQYQSIFPSIGRQIHYLWFTREATRTQGQTATSSAPYPVSSTVESNDATTVTPEDVLVHLLDGGKHTVDVDSLVQSFQKSFARIERRYEAQPLQPIVAGLEKKLTHVAKAYLKALEISIKKAQHGFTFAGDAVGLCEDLHRDPDTDFHKFIGKMRKIARRAHDDAKDTINDFSTVRRTLFKIMKRKPLGPQNVPGRAFITVSGDPFRVTWMDKQDRKMRQDSIDIADLLRKAADDVYELVQCVHKFVIWWSNVETMISGLRDQAASVDGLTMSEWRISGIRKTWEDVQKDYQQYKISVGALRDFIPVDQTSSP